MEMCYDGALVMPSSYAVMNEEEMTYVEGGISLDWSTVVKLGTAIIAVAGAVGTVFSAMNQVIKFGATVKGISEAAFAAAVGRKVSSVVGRITAWISKYAGIIACVVSTAIAVIGSYALGYYVGKRIHSGK